MLSGNREAGYGTIANHLNHPQMRGWYVLDEGGRSGPGGWRFAKTTWNSGTAMPHGWAIAEMWLLLRDCLVLEDGSRLRLLGGIPPQWFQDAKGMTIENLPTHFGSCSLAYKPDRDGATLTLSGNASPPAGYTLALPSSLKATVIADGTEIPRRHAGDCLLGPNTKRIRVVWIR